ncbi:MAG: hypothetical protein GWN00_14270 [Aliifodinibius sp.]|nr:hypothetical protein [Fodinibius sp.]NIV14959.1 hypothetical protein [Fodinibius sp.]NIY25928.1 hypothetical protein [Fodinibius sp.]
MIRCATAVSMFLFIAMFFVLIPPEAFAQTNSSFHKYELTTDHNDDNFPLSNLWQTQQFDFDNNPQQSASGKGSVKNVFLSLLLPGLGEWTMGHKGLGKAFLGAEVTLWLGFLASRQYMNVLQNDMQAFAAVHAGVSSADKDDQFWIDVGTAMSLQEFNSEKLLERDLEATYPEGQSYDWQWDSRDNRLNYVDRRLTRLDWERVSTIIIGGVVLNHIVSSIDVIRLLHKDNGSDKNQRQSYLYMDYQKNHWQGDIYKLNFTWLVN